MKNIMDWMIAEKIAKNDFNASAIVNGLELYKVEGDEAKKARVRLYRDWRNAGEPSNVAFQHAIKGDVIQALPMEGALLSEDESQAYWEKELSQQASDLDIRIADDGIN